MTTQKNEQLHDRPTRSSAHAESLDRQMGIAPAGGGTRHEGDKLILNAGIGNFPKFKAQAENTEGEAPKAKPKTAKEMIAALRAKAESDDDDAQEARDALAEFEDEEQEGDDEPEDSAPAPGQAFGKSEMRAMVQREMRAIRDAARRDQMIAARPDLRASVKKELSALSAGTVERMLKGIPVVASPAQAAILASKMQATTPGGSLTADGKTNFSAHAESLDREMGLGPKASKTGLVGNLLILGGAR